MTSGYHMTEHEFKLKLANLCKIMTARSFLSHIKKRNSVMNEIKHQDPPRKQTQGLRIFISHKGKDKIAAEKITDALELYGATNLKIFISERISPGVHWAAEIYDNLKQTDWLLLLYTDPSEEWDWCLFEAGFFAASIVDPKRRLICLHTLDDPPPMPLRGWQTVPVTDGNKMEKFLKLLFGEINPKLTESKNKLHELADLIAKAFQLKVRRKTKSKWFTRYVTLSMDAAQVKELIQTGRVSRDVLCGLKEKESVNIFGYGTGECTMEKLEEGLEEHYKESWLKAFGESLRAASLNKSPIPLIPILYSPSTQRDYHVILHCLHRFSDGSFEFHLLFIEKTPENEMEQGSELRRLGNMLKLGRAFRWKILTKFRRAISVLMQKKDKEKEIENCLEDLKLSMDWVVGESQRLDILTADDVVSMFEKAEDIREIGNAMEKIWPKLFEDMYAGFEDSDLTKVRNTIDEMLVANKDYMIRAAGRYKELMERLP